jgi:hypothetical protein
MTKSFSNLALIRHLRPQAEWFDKCRASQILESSLKNQAL